MPENKRQMTSLALTTIEQKGDESDEFLIQWIKDKTGMTNQSDIIRYALRIFRDKLEPQYIVNKKGSKKRQTFEKPEDRVKAQIQREKENQDAKNALKQEEGLNICKELDGEAIENASGTFNCRYEKYEKVGKNILTGAVNVPFDRLSDEHIQSQYKGGTKRQIKQLLKAKTK